MKKKFLLLTLSSAIVAYATEIRLDAISVTADIEEDILQEKVLKQSSQLAKAAKGETLGDFLQNEQFVDSASYGPAVGRPIVRGMDGYRVGVTNGNVIVNDLSAMSQDHAVGVMPRASEKIELIKGPSSLLYGNYSGGVVRVLGEEHNREFLQEGYHLDIIGSMGTNGAGATLGGVVKVSDGNFSLYGNTFYHNASEYRAGDGSVIKDTDTLSLQSHGVIGYRYDAKNSFKLYVDRLHKDYGIPNTTDASTTIIMDQERYGLVWHAKDIFGIKSMQSEIQTSDYIHSELEGSRYDGRFGQQQSSISTMLDFDVLEWDVKVNAEYGVSGLQVCHDHGKCTKFYYAERTGTDTGVGKELQENIDTFGLSYAHGHPMPNIHESNIKLGVAVDTFVDDDNELSATVRLEQRVIDPNSKNIQEQWLVTEQIDADYYDRVNDSAMSGSVGLMSYINDALSLQSSLSYVERFPSSTELFWNGFHHATDSYIFGDKNLENEKSLNFDVDVVASFENFTTQVSGFYYHFYNYIFQEPLADANGALLSDPFHQSDVWAMRGVGARVYGGALQEKYSTKMGAHTINTTASVEMIRGVLISGENLPRIPTYSAKIALEHLYKNYKANLSYKYVDRSRFNAENETPTPSYNWVSAMVSYENKSSFAEYSIYLKGENLTNDVAYNHLSFLKSTAPLARRQISVGVESKF